MTSQDIKRIVAEYISVVKNSGISVQEAYLFGSAAKGTMHSGSDIDVCIISPDFGYDRLEERVRLMNLRGHTSDLVEPHPYSPEDFNNLYDPLSSEIRKTGIRV